MCYLNLSDYLDNEEYKNVKSKVEKCPDANAYLSFDLSTRLINVMSGSECMSMMSGAIGADAMSMDSGPESQFHFEDLDK